MSIYYQNVRGLRTKTSRLRLALSSCDYDIIVLTETWLRPDIGYSELTSDYSIFRCDRSILSSQFLRGGGVLIAVKNNLQCETVSWSGHEHVEQVGVRIRLRGFSLYVVAVYIPPRSNPDLYAAHSSAIQQIVDTMSGTDIIMSLGDYNLPNLNWQLDEDINGYVPSNASSEQELTLVKTVFASGLQQINK